MKKCTKGIDLGTDHPFFPPLSKEHEEEEQQWLSFTTNYKAVADAFDTSAAEGVMGGNAIRLLRLHE